MEIFNHSASVYLGFFAPIVLGAFIGYVTNKIAIKMLFRPLKRWYVWKIPLPMTPGVIPSKRRLLADNIGEMVGEHLLTGKEIGEALQKDSFQTHLQTLIERRLSSLLQDDLGPMSSIIPQDYSSFYNHSLQSLANTFKEMVHGFLVSEKFTRQYNQLVEKVYDDLMDCDVDSLITRAEREEFYRIIDKWLQQLLTSPGMDEWVEDFVFTRVNNVLNRDKSLADILPEAFYNLILQLVEEKTPDLLDGAAGILKDPDVQNRIVDSVKKGVERFINTLGPISAMVHNFINIETIENKLREYLIEKEDDIIEWLQNKSVQEKMSATFVERVTHYLHVPLNEFIHDDSVDIKAVCTTMSKQIQALLREPATAETLSEMFRENIEMYIKSGAKGVGEIFTEIPCKQGNALSLEWTQQNGLKIVRSEKGKELLNSGIDTAFTLIQQRKIGKIGRLIPDSIQRQISETIKEYTVSLLTLEIPGVVNSLNIREIVSVKINSLDILRLERLLLSIMEEQFKYINLFGALLGGLIGVCNLFVWYFLKTFS